VTLLASSLATGGALFVLILGLGPSSGAHFDPVALIEAVSRPMPRAHVPAWLVPARVPSKDAA